MKILLLSSETSGTSTEILVKSLQQKGFKIIKKDPRDLFVQYSPTQVFDNHKKQIVCDLVIPRLGLYTLDQGLHILRAFEANGVKILNSSYTIELCQNKLRQSALFALHKIPSPRTYVFEKTNSIVNDIPFKYPIVTKVLNGSQGKGVALIQNKSQLSQWVDLLRTSKVDYLLQQYVTGKDIRALVFNNEILGSIYRIPPQDDFRANISLGATAKKIALTAQEEELIIRVSKIFNIQFGGIDFIRTPKGPIFLEVNAFPGLKGISAATKKSIGMLVARKIRSLYEHTK